MATESNLVLYIGLPRVLKRKDCDGMITLLRFYPHTPMYDSPEAALDKHKECIRVDIPSDDIQQWGDILTTTPGSTHSTLTVTDNESDEASLLKESSAVTLFRNANATCLTQGDLELGPKSAARSG